MIHKPFVVRDTFDESALAMIQAYTQEFMQKHKLPEDLDDFHRRMCNDPPLFVRLQHVVITPLLEKLLKTRLRPTYCFLSSYTPGKGICPMHVDRAECGITFDLCVNQKRPWPLYVAPTLPELGLPDQKHIRIHGEAKETAITNGEAFLLNPGDALVYSGTHHPHWRNRLEEDNFCDLVFFHFLPEND